MHQPVLPREFPGGRLRPSDCEAFQAHRGIAELGRYLSEDGSGAEIGFTLQPSSQGRGIAGRAVGEALQLMFWATQVARVLGITDERNVPSIRLLERLGFELVESREVVFRGQACTERVYALPRRGG